MAIPKGQNCCLTLLSWIPVVFIIGVFGWSYYAYVVQMCLCRLKISFLFDIVLLFVERYDRKHSEERWTLKIFSFCFLIDSNWFSFRIISVIYLVIYHLLVIIFLWSYGRTIFTASIVPPRQVEKDFSFSRSRFSFFFVEFRLVFRQWNWKWKYIFSSNHWWTTSFTRSSCSSVDITFINSTFRWK